MVISDRSLAGYYGSQPVYRIEDVLILPLHDLDILLPATVRTTFVNPLEALLAYATLAARG